MRIKVLLLAPVIVFAFTGCYYDKEEELYGLPAPCEAGPVTYMATVRNILTAYGCISCHSGANPSGNISLQEHPRVRAVAANGKLLGAINHNTGFSPMPMGGSKMTSCDIEKIKAWVDGGALNN